MYARNDIIKEEKVSLGSLVFIYHKRKPFKTGWWRKIKDGCDEIYFLEKPLHKDFTIDDGDRVENGTYVMRSSTVKYDNDFSKGSYEIMCVVSGSNQFELAKNNYNISYVEEDKFKNDENVCYTHNFIKLVDYYVVKNIKTDVYEKLAEDLC